MGDLEKKKGEVTYEITEHIGVIAQYPNNWTKELNVISWNGNHPKYDLRDWDDKHAHMSRGITLHLEEVKILKDLLSDVQLS